EGGSHIASGGKAFTEMWKEGNLSAKAAEEFTPRMHTFIFPAMCAVVDQGFFKDSKFVVDIGGGSGALGLALDQAKSHLTYGLFELPPVCKVAKKFLRNTSSIDKKFYPGSFFDSPWPRSPDTIVFSNIFH